VAHRYHKLLADTPLQLPLEAENVESCYHLYVVRHPRRDELKKHLEAHKIAAPPLSRAAAPPKMLRRPRLQARRFPRRRKSRPPMPQPAIYPELTDAQVDRVRRSSGIF